MKYKLRKKIMTEFVGLRAKDYSYLIDHKIKKQNTEKCVS